MIQENFSARMAFALDLEWGYIKDILRRGDIWAKALSWKGKNESGEFKEFVETGTYGMMTANAA